MKFNRMVVQVFGLVVSSDSQIQQFSLTSPLCQTQSAYFLTSEGSFCIQYFMSTISLHVAVDTWSSI
jgi:hypothetical protein